MDFNYSRGSFEKLNFCMEFQQEVAGVSRLWLYEININDAGEKKRKVWKDSENIAPYHRAGYPPGKQLLKDLKIFKPEIFICTHSTE